MHQTMPGCTSPTAVLQTLLAFEKLHWTKIFTWIWAKGSNITLFPAGSPTSLCPPRVAPDDTLLTMTPTHASRQRCPPPSAGINQFNHAISSESECLRRKSARKYTRMHTSMSHGEDEMALTGLLGHGWEASSGGCFPFWADLIRTSHLVFWAHTEDQAGWEHVTHTNRALTSSHLGMCKRLKHLFTKKAEKLTGSASAIAKSWLDTGEANKANKPSVCSKAVIRWSCAAKLLKRFCPLACPFRWLKYEIALSMISNCSPYQSRPIWVYRSGYADLGEKCQQNLLDKLYKADKLWCRPRLTPKTFNRNFPNTRCW